MAIDRGLTFRMAQPPVQRWLPDLVGHIDRGKTNRSLVVSHRAFLEGDQNSTRPSRTRRMAASTGVLKP